MNKDRAKELLPIIQAFAEGAAVQVQLLSSGGWVDTSDPKWSPHHEYRIKPEPREWWVNVYPSRGGGAYTNKHDAEKHLLKEGKTIKVREVLDE